MSQETYDGALISELGVRRYLKATKDIKVSNLNFLLRGNSADRAWQECSFGCHGPTYRSFKKPSTRGELLKPIEALSPLLAGVVDGVQHQTVGKIDRLGGGIERTAEGLGVNGGKAFSQVGSENTAAYDFAKTTFEKLITFEIDTIDNPLTQLVMAVVGDYVSALPEWLLEETLKQGALKFPEKIDTVWLLKSTAKGLTENVDQETLGQAASLLNNPTQKLIGKQLGKKLAVAIAYAIASSITKQLMKKSPEVPLLKRQLVLLRKAARKSKGGLGSALLSLLEAQGFLHKAGASSRRLEQRCPRLWRLLRYKLHGANMIYFLVETMVGEYVDRLALLESNPREFGKVMEALIRDKKTQSVFYPSI